MNGKQTMGDLMRSQRREAIRSACVFMAVILYAAVLIYTGVHNFNLFSRMVPPDQQLFAIAALMCLEGAAIFLPLAIHFWLAPGPQRMVGYLLYISSFTIVIFNTIFDSLTNRMEKVPEWLSLYGMFILPVTPILIGVGIAFIFVLAPEKKIHDARAAAETAAIDVQALHMRDAASAPEANARIATAAKQQVRELLTQLFGEDDGAEDDGVKVTKKEPPAITMSKDNSGGQRIKLTKEEFHQWIDAVKGMMNDDTDDQGKDDPKP